MLKDLLLNCRSYRRFHQEVSIPTEDLKDMVDNTRLTASASNAQALKFKIVNTPAECAKVFSTVKWAGALTDWDGPAEGERPSLRPIPGQEQTVGRRHRRPDHHAQRGGEGLRRLHDRQL